MDTCPRAADDSILMTDERGKLNLKLKTIPWNMSLRITIHLDVEIQLVDMNLSSVTEQEI